MKILIYFPTSSRAVDQLSVMEMLIQQGHEVLLLTYSAPGILHQLAEKIGVKTYSARAESTNGIQFYISQLRFLKAFLDVHKIQMIFAHLQVPGLIAALATRKISIPVYYFRHNTDEHIIRKSRKAALINYFTNKVNKHIIAPSDKVYKYLKETEKVPAEKLLRINYGYNFQMYLATDRQGLANEIRKQYDCKMLLVSVARLVVEKRHNLMIEVVQQLVEKGLDVKLVCLSDGILMDSLKARIKELGLTNHIFLLGRKDNVFDYLEAADLFLHLSQTEASNSALKEAGYCSLPAIACDDVGDFSDYIHNDANGYIVSKQNPVPETVAILENLYKHPEKLKLLGENMKQTIVETFSIQVVAPQYSQIFKKIL